LTDLEDWTSGYLGNAGGTAREKKGERGGVWWKVSRRLEEVGGSRRGKINALLAYLPEIEITRRLREERTQ